MATVHGNAPVRGTQLLVEHMSALFRRPSLVAIEIALALAVRHSVSARLLAADADRFLRHIRWSLPAPSSIDTQNPWVAARAALECVPRSTSRMLLAVLRWLLPAAALAWIIVSGAGPQLLLMRMEPRRALSAPRDDRAARRMAGAAGADVLGLVPLHAVGRRPRTSPQPASRIWWATLSGRSFCRWDSSRRWRWRVGRCRSRRFLLLLERRSALSALGQALRLGRRSPASWSRSTW